MKTSIYQKMNKLQLYKKARDLYVQGWTLREVASILGKSRQWVLFVVRGRGIKELERLELRDLTRFKKI